LYYSTAAGFIYLGFGFFFGFFFGCCGTEAPTAARASLATQAGQTNKYACESTGLADQYNMLCDGTLTPLLCLLLVLLLCQFLLLPLLLHCDLQLLQRVCIRKEGVDFVGASIAPTMGLD
jgi:hypothetical protein